MFEEWLWLRVVGSREACWGERGQAWRGGQGHAPQLGMRAAGKPSWKAGSGVARADQRPGDVCDGAGRG